MKVLKVKSNLNKQKSKSHSLNLFTLLMVAIVIFSATACKKYEDGPVISLASRTSRVANDWKIGEAFDNGNNVTSSFTQYDLNLTTGGSATLTANYSLLGVEINFVSTGTWKFGSNQEQIVFDYDNDIADAVYRILRLKENELWLSQDGKSLELHLIPR